MRHAKAVLIASFIIAIAASAGMVNLTSNPDNRVFFSQDNPELQALEALENTYSKTDNVFIAMAPVSGTLADPDYLAVVREFTAAAWQIPFSSRVDSLSNYQHTLADGDDLLVTDLIPEDTEIDQEQADKAIEIALQKEFLVNRLISADATVSGINITILKPVDNRDAVYEILSHVRALIDDFETCLLYTSPSPRDLSTSRMPSSA